MDFKLIEKMDKLYQNKHYLKDRDLSTLEFQFRILDLIYLTETPFMEKLNFLKIVCNNIEEFISIRLPDANEDKRNSLIHTIEKLYKQMGLFLDDINIANNVLLNESIQYIQEVPDKSFRFIYSGESTHEIEQEMTEVISIKESTNTKTVLYNGGHVKKDATVICYIKVPTCILLIEDYYKYYISICKGNPYNYYCKDTNDVFEYDYYQTLKEKDILIHNPYQPYQNVVNFIHQMCINPNIQMIFITLYRTATDSKIVKNLLNARRLGKEVYVYIEPTARGNEEENLKNIQSLQALGIHVSCNYYNYKVHGKLFCAVDKDNIIYTHIGTGNYNEITGNFYTDFHLLTTQEDICTEALRILMSLFRKDIYKATDEDSHLYSSPLNFRGKIIKLIDQERDKKERGLIRIKCNSICDCAVIDKLYQAADAGCKIEIICRTSCSIRLHKNIEIRSKVGKYLEHDRFYIFGDQVFISSADLLLRNINKRLEILCEITNISNKIFIKGTFFNLWNDHLIHKLQEDGKWKI